MSSTTFIRTIENFTCEHCGKTVKGNGYTNHCPYCLWSKHVDIYPGDRASDCLGLMEPVGIDQKRGNFIVVHLCTKCGYSKRNKVSKNDDFTVVTRLMAKSLNK